MRKEIIRLDAVDKKKERERLTESDVFIFINETIVCLTTVKIAAMKMTKRKIIERFRERKVFNEKENIFYNDKFVFHIVQIYVYIYIKHFSQITYTYYKFIF